MPRSLVALLLLGLLALSASAAVAQPVLDFEWGHPWPQGDTVFGFAFADAATGWAVCGGGAVLATTDGGESWAVRSMVPGNPHLYDLLLRADGALLAVGESPALFLSTDGGFTWSTPAHAAPGKLVDLARLPGGGISAVGDAGALLLSADGGFTWSTLSLPTGHALRHHCWTSDQVCMVASDDGAWRTPDAGGTWVQPVSGVAFGINEVYFTDAMTGYLVEDFATWTTTNGGLNWTEHFNPTPPLYRYRTLPLSATHWLVSVAIEGGEFWETTDAGLNWTQHLYRGVLGFPSLYQAPGGRVFFGSDAGDLYYTDDNGATITNAAINLTDAGPNPPMNFLMARPDGVVFAANQPSQWQDPQAWLRSEDGGRHWAALADPPSFRWAQDGGFFDNTKGLVGSYADIAYTADGGATWLETALPGEHRVWRFALPAANRFFVSTWTSAGGGGLFRSTDGGATWTPLAGTGGLPTAFFGAGLAFLDSQQGWLSCRQGAVPKLFKTVDGGTTWTPVAAAGLGDFVDDLHWFDAQTGLAAGRSANCPGVYRTTTGGASWTQVDPELASRFAFRDALHGATVFGYSGSPRFTEDGGLSWQPLAAPFDAGLPHHAGSYVFAVLPTAEGWLFGGQNGRLLLGVDETITAAPPVAAGAAAGPAARLLGAHPNPFNPSTRLALRAERAGRVRLALHDASGRRLRILLEAELAAGETRNVTWDGRDEAGRALPTGVYLARLESEGGAEGRKLLLLK